MVPVARLGHLDEKTSQKFAHCTESLKILKIRNVFNLIINRNKIEIDVTLYFEGLKIVKK